MSPYSRSQAASPSSSLTPHIHATHTVSTSQPFLHPTVSRLRSFTPHRPSHPTTSSVASYQSNHLEGNLSPSHFSAISRASSISLRHSVTASHTSTELRSEALVESREAFRWTKLQVVGSQIFSTRSQKASAVLGSSWGTPTVLAANGLICIGTDQGRVLIFDFRQQFKFVCGGDSGSK